MVSWLASFTTTIHLHCLALLLSLAKAPEPCGILHGSATSSILLASSSGRLEHSCGRRKLVLIGQTQTEIQRDAIHVVFYVASRRCGLAYNVVGMSEESFVVVVGTSGATGRNPPIVIDPSIVRREGGSVSKASDSGLQ